MALPFLSESSSILFDLLFSDKERLIPIADLRFELDVDGVEKIIIGISKQSSFGTNFKR
jgi:hypothetical protein